MINLIVETALNLNLWKRQRIPFELKAEAVVLVLAGLSLADAARHLAFKGYPVARQKVGEWVQQFQKAASWMKTVPRAKRGTIAVDETKVKINGKEAFIWGAIDVKTQDLLAVEVSWERSGARAVWFLRDVQKKCVNLHNVLIITDGAGWYPWACRRLGLRHKRVVGGLRNKIERWWRTFKEWARTFYKNFITRSTQPVSYVRERVELWTGLWYNALRLTA